MNKPSSLLIPIRLRAAVTDKSPGHNINSDFSYNFTGMGEPYAVIEKPLFSERQRRAPGIYLHWSLPACFTQGFQTECTAVKNDTEITYRLAPNRWAVIRLWHPSAPADGEDRLFGRTFMLESDVLSKLPTGGPSWPWPKDTAQPYRYLGRSYPMDAEPAPASNHLRLTAVSPVSPFFAAYAPFCENVFSFYDDLSADNLCDASLCYLVCGWYEEHGEPEPFQEIHDWETLRTQFGLACSNGDFPERTLCHGMIDQIQWHPEAIPCTSLSSADGPRQAPACDLAIGNNVSEALSVLLSDQQACETQQLMNLMLQGFDQDLDRRQGMIKAEENIQNTKFDLFHVSGITGIHKQPSKAGKETSVSLPQKYIQNLTALRKKQRALSQSHAVLLQKQRSIYENWYLSLYADEPYIELYSRQTALAMEDARLKLHAFTKELSDSDHMKTALENELQQIDPAGNYELTDERDEPFYLPTDPALLLSQDALPDEILPETSADHPLLCRVSGQTVSALTISGIALYDITLTGRSLLPVLPISSRVPAMICEDILSLAAETILLSTGFAGFLSRRIFQNAGVTPTQDQLAQLCSQIQKAQSCGTQTCSLFTGLLPMPPALTGFHPQGYPLILEWQCSYYPDNNIMCSCPDLSRWTLSDGDYIYTCPAEYDSIIHPDNEYTVEGRLYISDHAQTHTEKLIDRLVAPDHPIHAALLKHIRQKVRFSQSLDGFGDSLLMRRQALAPALYTNDPEQQSYVDILKTLDSSVLNNRPLFDLLYAPARAGFFRITKLRIIDALGRFRDIDYPDIYAPACLRDPQTPNPASYLMLPPRLLQPARLNAYFITAGDTELPESLCTNMDSPICGFILPDLLTYGLTVYRGDGTLAGSLNTIRTGSNICWKDPSGLTTSDHLPPGLDPELHAFLTGLHQAGASALAELIEYINTLQTHSQSGSHTPSRIELIGKPIALARLGVRLEMLGDAEPYRHYIGEAEKDKTSETNIYAARFPLLIGNLTNPADGTIGFFEDGNYNCLHIYPETPDDHPNHNNTYFIRSHRTTLCPDPKTDQKVLTLLFDPWADITLTTGILPVRTMALAKSLTEQILQNMKTSYFCSPVLTGPQITLPIPHSDSLTFSWECLSKDGQTERTVLHYEDTTMSNPDEQIHIAEGYVHIQAKDIQ